MYLRPELRKGDVDVRIKAPGDLVEKLDLVAAAVGSTRQDVILIALDTYIRELSQIAKVLAPAVDPQRSRSGVKTPARP